MTVSAVYTPAPGEVPGELDLNQFTAGSLLNLTCSVEGHSEGLSYSWSVSGNPSTPGCYSCYTDTLSTTSALIVGKPLLYSYYAGNYTCTVTETGRPNSMNSDNFTVTVDGEFISYFTTSFTICL